MSPRRAADSGWGRIAGVGDPQLWWKGTIVRSFKDVFIRLIEHYRSLDHLYVSLNTGIRWTGVLVRVPCLPHASHPCISRSCASGTCARSFSVSMLQPCWPGLVFSKVVSRDTWILEVTLKGSALAKRLRNYRSSSLWGKGNMWKANLGKLSKLYADNWHSCSFIKGCASMTVWRVGKCTNPRQL